MLLKQLALKPTIKSKRAPSVPPWDGEEIEDAEFEEIE